MTLKELEALASEKLAENNEETRTDFLRILNTGLLMDIINNLIGSQRELDDVASRSYCHNNGFLKIVLIDKRPKYSIRFHIWSENQIQECDVHNHPWDMSGLVLNGSYEWSMYSLDRIQEELECFCMYECKYLKDYSGHSFHKKNKVTLNQVDIFSFQRGDIFQLHQSQYHSIGKDNADPADSIVITGDSEKLTANVITCCEIFCDSIFINTPVKGAFLKKKLVSFMGRS